LPRRREHLHARALQIGAELGLQCTHMYLFVCVYLYLSRPRSRSTDIYSNMLTSVSLSLSFSERMRCCALLLSIITRRACLRSDGFASRYMFIIDRRIQKKAEGVFRLTPGKLLTFKYNLLLPQKGREPSAEIPSRVNSVKPPR